MANFEQIEDIIEEINQYNPDVDSAADKKFYTQFAFPKTLERFIALVECLVNQHRDENLKRDRLTSILADCIYTDNSLSELLYLRFISPNVTNPILCLKLVNILVSLPELISNLYAFNCPSKLTARPYLERLCAVLRQLLQQVHANLNSFNLTHIYLVVTRLCLKGHHQIVWDNLLQNIVCHLANDNKWLQIARQILLNDSTHSEAFSNQSMLIEPVFKMIFANSSCHRSIDKLLSYEHLQAISGMSTLVNKVKFLLTNKFLLIFQCEPLASNSINIDAFLLNIFTYLYTNNRQWLRIATENVLDTWANLNGFRHRPYHQHFYLCRQIIIIAKLHFQCKHEASKEILSKFHRIIIFGTELHLKSSQMQLRVIGLTTSVIVLDLLAKFSGISIEVPKFEETQSSDDDCVFLKKLASIDMERIFNIDPTDYRPLDENISPQESIPPNHIPMTASKSPNKNDIKHVQLDSDDDEDDDLQPFDLCNDIRVEDDIRYVGKDVEPSKRDQSDNIQNTLLIETSRQTPIYLQDCINGLAQTEKPLYAEKCLLSAERIIRANFTNTSDKLSTNTSMEYGRLNSVALKFAQILFNLDNQVAISNFYQLRLDALVALCVGAPKIVAKYLSEQFYAPYLPIRSRLDILTVLTAASEELCMPLAPVETSSIKSVKNGSIQKEPSKGVIQFQRKYFGITNSWEEGDDSDDDQNEQPETKNWQSIVSQRIRSNTRIISRQHLKQNLDSSSSYHSTSRFVPVSGYFFFPLLRDPHKTEIRLNLDEEDSYVLEQLFYSLGVLLKNCVNYSQVNLMSKELLQFMSSFRNHQHRLVIRLHSYVLCTYLTFASH